MAALHKGKALSSSAAVTAAGAAAADVVVDVTTDRSVPRRAKWAGMH